MGLMILSCIAAILFVIFGMMSAPAGETKPKPKEPVAKEKPATEEDKTSSQEDVRKKLQRLSQTEAPKKLSPGAMCYARAAPPRRAEYVCRTCNEKTLYANKEGEWGGMPSFISWELQACRRAVKQIKGLKLSLDESPLCKKCSPNAKKNELVLVVDYGDPKKLHKVSGINLTDLSLLREFMDGKLKHDAGQSGEKPLKDYLKRLEALLGVELEETKTKK